MPKKKKTEEQPEWVRVPATLDNLYTDMSPIIALSILFELITKRTQAEKMFIPHVYGYHVSKNEIRTAFVSIGYDSIPQLLKRIQWGMSDADFKTLTNKLDRIFQTYIDSQCDGKEWI